METKMPLATWVALFYPFPLDNKKGMIYSNIIN